MREIEKSRSTETTLLTTEEGRNLIVELSAEFHRNGWMTGTGGALAIKTEKGILVTPSGVLKERQNKDDIFLISAEGEVLETPVKKLKISSCLPNFLHIYRIRNSDTIYHLHSVNAVLVSLMEPGNIFRCKHLQMVKGMRGFGWEDTLEIPIVENRANEDDISENIKEALDRQFKADCILIRGHGLYTWGTSWIQAKVHAESLDWIFKVVLESKKLGIQINCS
ncbi:probable methylthioribulose-1-phosphate dehydratase isoform X2 [Eurytemora carolleeae]|uniref:probable methylthioribulose-1-phosphate dehydratase isoform X2 n=1 Tax=Eurytemora carolleeae TaxID=1294199 RepID=UPI000C78E60F|nr:probable methylthioribulose-1-phosphate dehydratase isoform X2 [Eurytemora carolleeae]|eukprot:XP_023334020.1 probable methylthioribulose-1-phosphate dehydratase isoform X2 [Eurytemora affinis]